MSIEENQEPEGMTEAPRMEEIRPNMTDADKKRVLEEILRVLRGGE
jgi:hypothetical protein